MNRRTILLTVFLFISGTVPLFGQDLPKLSPPEQSGFSSERLDAVTKFFQGAVDQGAIPGAVVLVFRDNRVVYLQSVGYQDREKNIPMKPDTIFRMASMTKPVASVAVMMLVEEGKIDLAAPVSRYLPEFKHLKVGVDKVDLKTGKPALTFEDVQREMTVQDLLRHTSGLVYGPFGNTLVHQAYQKADLFNPDQTLAEFVTKLSKLPLAHQPGTAWEYGMSIDVLGRIAEVTSGKAFDRFVEERITKPLGMPDTHFYVSSAQSSRVAEMQVDAATGKRPGSPAASLTKEKIKWISGGGGLLSTAPDYARFCQMLLNGGELNGVRLLSAKTVAMMDSDQLSPDMPRIGGYEDLNPSPELGQSFGLGFAVRTRASDNPRSGSPGDFFWAGIYGTYFWVDPKEKLFAVMMVQMPFEKAGPYRRKLRELVYGALVH